MKIAVLTPALVNLLLTGRTQVLGLNLQCTVPARGLSKWMYLDKGTITPIEGCTTKWGTINVPWTMLNAYRSGGPEFHTWFYTDDPNNPECLKDWTYYAADGKTVISQVSGRLTKLGADKNWCARATYQPGGIPDHQWSYCSCTM